MQGKINVEVELAIKVSEILIVSIVINENHSISSIL
jgi:hypothetical protein